MAGPGLMHVWISRVPQGPGHTVALWPSECGAQGKCGRILSHAEHPPVTPLRRANRAAHGFALFPLPRLFWTVFHVKASQVMMPLLQGQHRDDSPCPSSPREHAGPSLCRGTFHASRGTGALSAGRGWEAAKPKHSGSVLAYPLCQAAQHSVRSYHCSSGLLPVGRSSRTDESLPSVTVFCAAPALPATVTPNRSAPQPGSALPTGSRLHCNPGPHDQCSVQPPIPPRV